MPQSQASIKVWQGQFPPPEAIEHYEKVLPGAFDRIITMTEQLQKAQIVEAEQIRLNTKNDISRGQWLGFVTAISALLAAVCCAVTEHPVVACECVGLPIIAVAILLVNSAKKEKPSDIVKELSQGQENKSDK